MSPPLDLVVGDVMLPPALAMPITVAFLIAGLALLVLLVTDAFVTVFHAGGHGGPLSRLLTRTGWRSFRLIGNVLDSPRRERWLSLGGPCLVLAALVMWIGLLVCGFALLYYPFASTFLFSPGSFRGAWVESVYYSGYTAATLGFGDMIPDFKLLRLMAPVQAFGGFALLSASVTYVLAIYRELVNTQRLAADIEGYLRAARPLEQAPEHQEAVARWMESVNHALLHVTASHYEYPLLHYFRPVSSSRALPPQIAKLEAIVRTVRQSGHPLGSHPSFLSLADTLNQYLAMTNDLFVPAAESRPPGEDTADPRIGALLQHLAYGDPDVRVEEMRQ